MPVKKQKEETSSKTISNRFETLNKQQRIQLLKQNILKCKENKNNLQTKIQELKTQQSSGDIDYAQYQLNLNQLLKGRSLTYWQAYYQEYQTQVEQKIKKLRTEKIVVQEQKPYVLKPRPQQSSDLESYLIYGFAFIIMALIGFVFFQGGITGFATFDGDGSGSLNMEVPHEWYESNWTVRVFTMSDYQDYVKEQVIREAIPINLFPEGENADQKQTITVEFYQEGQLKKSQQFEVSSIAELKIIDSSQIIEEVLTPVEENFPEPVENITELITPENVTEPVENITESITPENATEPITSENITLPVENVTEPIENITEPITPENITEPQPEETPEQNITLPTEPQHEYLIENDNIKLKQKPGSIFEEVEWEIEIENPDLQEVTFSIPKQAKNLKIYKIIHLGGLTLEEEVTNSNLKVKSRGVEIDTTIVTGFVTYEPQETKTFQKIAKEFLSAGNLITGLVVVEEKSREITIEDLAIKYKIYYSTPQPTMSLEPVGYVTKIRLSAPLDYYNLVAGLTIPPTKKEDVKLVQTINYQYVELTANYLDQDLDNKIDLIEWNVSKITKEEPTIYYVLYRQENGEFPEKELPDLTGENILGFNGDNILPLIKQENLTQDNLTLSQKVRTGQPGKWKRKIKFKKNESRFSIALPLNITNITLFGKKQLTPDEYAITELGSQTLISIFAKLKELTIYYQTLGPTKTERQITPNIKEITINSEYPYEIIIAQTILNNTQKFKLFRYRGTTKTRHLQENLSSEIIGTSQQLEWAVNLTQSNKFFIDIFEGQYIPSQKVESISYYSNEEIYKVENPKLFYVVTNEGEKRADKTAKITFDTSSIGDFETAEICAYQPKVLTNYYLEDDWEVTNYITEYQSTNETTPIFTEIDPNWPNVTINLQRRWKCISITEILKANIQSNKDKIILIWTGHDIDGGIVPLPGFTGIGSPLTKCEGYTPLETSDCRPYIRIK